MQGYVVRSLFLVIQRPHKAFQAAIIRLLQTGAFINEMQNFHDTLQYSVLDTVLQQPPRKSCRSVSRTGLFAPDE